MGWIVFSLVGIDLLPSSLTTRWPLVLACHGHWLRSQSPETAGVVSLMELPPASIAVVAKAAVMVAWKMAVVVVTFDAVIMAVAAVMIE